MQLWFQFHELKKINFSEPSRDVPHSGGRKTRPANRQKSSGHGGGGGPPRVGPGAPLPAIPSKHFSFLKSLKCVGTQRLRKS